jgi:DNA-binding CsgD family transcriptional regulator
MASELSLRPSGRDRVTVAAFEAGLPGLAAATAYALLLVLVRTDGGAQTSGAAWCALLLAGLAVVAREPQRAFAKLRRRPLAGVVLAALAGVALAAVGPDNRLLFLPTLLLLALLGTAAGARPTLALAALATAGLLTPLALDPAAIGDRRMLALTAAGLLAIPPLLAALVARAAEPADAVEAPLPATAPPTATPPHPADPSPLTPRQLDAVALTAAGLRHAEIAERLGVSVHQVRRLLRQGRERVGASTTRELVAWAMTRGLVGSSQGVANGAETEAIPAGD